MIRILYILMGFGLLAPSIKAQNQDASKPMGVEADSAQNSTSMPILPAIYKLELKQELKIGLTAASVLMGSHYLIESQPKITDAELETLDSSEINRTDRRWASRYSGSSTQASDISLVSSFALGLSSGLTNKDEWLSIFILHAETVGVAIGGSQLSKALIRRHRPRVYPGTDLDMETRLEPDQINSFFSGHSTGIASNLFFFTKVYLDQNSNTPYQSYIWGGTFLAAGVMSWQRVLAGAHFPTDVLLGVSWGALVGYWIPELHKKGNGTQISVEPWAEGENPGLKISYLY